MNSERSYGGRNSNEEIRVLEKSRSLLNWLTQRNFDKIKDEIVHTVIRSGSPSAFVIKSLVCCIFDMAMVDNAYVLFSCLCVELFHALPPFPSDGDITTFEKLFFRKCRLELQKSSPESETDRPPLVFLEESSCWRFIKTVSLLAAVFNNGMLSQTTRQTIIQVLMNPISPPQRNTDAMNYFLSSIGKLADFQFCDDNLKHLLQTSRLADLEKRCNEEARVRKEAEEALSRNIEELELMKRLLESYKEEEGQLHLRARESEQNHQEELRLRKAAECALAIQQETTDKVKRQLETLENEHDQMRLKAEMLVILREESEIALAKEMSELEEMKQELETCKTEQEKLSSQVRTWQNKCEQESRVRKETEDALCREKQELEIVKGLLESFNQAAESMREERDEAQKTVQELTRKQSEEREPPSSFSCPITQEVMKDPQIAADGFTYEAEAIKRWLSTGHDTSPMTNLKLSHRTLIPNRALRSAINELV